MCYIILIKYRNITAGDVYGKKTSSRIETLPTIKSNEGSSLQKQADASFQFVPENREPMKQASYLRRT
jgi:hypothetical protein